MNSLTVRFLTCVSLVIAFAVNSFAISLDPNFAAGGKFVTTFAGQGNPSSWATNVFVQQSGRIVMIGSHLQDGLSGRTSGIVLAGINSAGTLDTGFGTGGKVLVWDPAASSNLIDALMNPDGSTVLLSQFQQSSVSTPGLVRYSTDGALDASFASDLNIEPGHTVAIKIASGAEGRIYVLLRGSSANIYYLVRLNANGSRDTTFGPAGVRNIGFDRLRSRSIAGVHELSSGKIVVTGYFDSNQFSTDMFAARFNADASLDRSFGRQGIMQILIPNGTCWMLSSVVQPDGKLLIGGAYTFLGSYALLVRLTTRGRPDPDFGTQGISMTSFEDINVIQGIALSPDGKVAVTGNTGDKTVPSLQQLFVARYTAGGSRESGFEMTYFPNVRASSLDIALQADGKVVIAGSSGVGSTNFDQLTAARFLP